MSTPARQRSLRERLHGISISWQGKKSKSYHSKELAEAQTSSEGDLPPKGKEEDEEEKQEATASAKDEEGSSTVPEKETEKKPVSRTLTQPQGTQQYQVVASDTLAGIAARFDTTPSELAKLNRLSARIVFPGQTLFVPEKKRTGEEEEEEEEEPKKPTETSSNETNQGLRATEQDRRPSVTESLRIPFRRPSDRAHRFLKVKARHFTDGQGVVSGVLIITPNAVMFDPNVSDPLVLEQGVESYGVIAPLDMLMRTAIYFDIAHMKVRHAAHDPRPKADVYYGKMNHEPSTEPTPEKERAPKPCIEEKTPSIEVAPIQEDTTPATPKSSPTEGARGPSQDSVDSLDAEVSSAFSEPQFTSEEVQSESRRERMLKRLSYPMESITSISRILTSSPKSFVDFSGSLLFPRPSEEDEDQQEKEATTPTNPNPPVLKNLVEEKPEIFEALDKLLNEKKARGEQEGDPLYLCLRMGTPKERKPHPSPVLSYGKKRCKSEYWFSIPHNRVEDLYNFLQQWIPHLYGDVEDIEPEAAGFEPIDDTLPSPEEEEEEETPKEGDSEDTGEETKPRSFLKLVEDHFGFRSISPSDWEVLSLGEMEKVAYSDMELPLPDLLLPSEILTEDHIKQLYTLLPARAVGYPWSRIFSTGTDGFRLKTLYSKMTDHDGPVLLILQDSNDAVFGSLLSSALRQSDHFYGTGESFLFTFHPEFQVFKWTGNNTYFVKGNVDSIAIGAGEGLFGLWVDSDLYRGTTKRCLTYDNEPLSASEDFTIRSLEAWGFV